MPPQMRLDQALSTVVAAATAVLDGATGAGGLLDGISEVISGERARRRPDPPYLWVAPGPWTEQHNAALHARVTALLLVNAFVASENPEEGWLEAVLWAAKARSVLLTDRQLGLGFVQDVQSTGGEPIGRIRDGRRFGAMSRVNVIFTIRE